MRATSSSFAAAPRRASAASDALRSARPHPRAPGADRSAHSRRPLLRVTVRRRRAPGPAARPTGHARCGSARARPVRARHRLLLSRLIPGGACLLDALPQGVDARGGGFNARAVEGTQRFARIAHCNRCYSVRSERACSAEANSVARASRPTARTATPSRSLAALTSRPVGAAPSRLRCTRGGLLSCWATTSASLSATSRLRFASSRRRSACWTSVAGSSGNWSRTVCTSLRRPASVAAAATRRSDSSFTSASRKNASRSLSGRRPRPAATWRTGLAVAGPWNRRPLDEARGAVSRPPRPPYAGVRAGGTREHGLNIAHASVRTRDFELL